MAYDDNNIFAKILRGEAPCIKVYEDDNTFSFMDVMPQAEGHTLVIPKAPAENLFDLEPEHYASLAQATQKIAAAVRQAIGSPGVMIAQLNGAEAGQTVFHFHNHIIPRWSGLEMKLHAREMADMAELEEQAQKIRAAL
ncbi:MAG: HIT family protein [Rhodobiaceae bacterium]|nr:HIT family protein [Rhodobiaceae bacterium]